MLSSTLKQKLSKNQKTLGVMMTFDFWPGYLEICRKHGLDFIILDMEHGGVELPRVEELCRTARLLDLPLLIRPQSCNSDQIKRIIDIGGAGLMIPWVETQEQLDTLHDSAFCPPRGRHGMGGPSIFSVDGLSSRDWAQLEEGLFIMCQIETPKGLDFASHVAAQDWVDALMVGPYDLAHNLGVLDRRLEAEQHIRAIERVRDAAHGQNTWAGMVAGTGEEALNWFDRGFDMMILGAIVTHLIRGLTENIAAARGSQR